MNYTRRTQLNRLLCLLAGGILLSASAGCGRGSWENDDTAPFTPRAAPVAVASGMNFGVVKPPSAGSDPQLPRGGDPQIDSADPLATSRHDNAESGSRLADARSLGAGKSAVGETQGWYWVVGSIQSGQIGIAVNGTPIGRYSVHVDKEITALCHPGLNTLAFTHYPLLGSSQQICPTHLEIVDGHAAKGAPPLMVYDTAADIPTDQTTGAPASSASGEDVLSATGVDSSGNPDNAASAAPAAAPPTPPSSSAPYTDVRSFSSD